MSFKKKIRESDCLTKRCQGTAGKSLEPISGCPRFPRRNWWKWHVRVAQVCQAIVDRWLKVWALEIAEKGTKTLFQTFSSTISINDVWIS